MNLPDKLLSTSIRTRIALTGFMAAGKSTIGAELARELSFAFIDLDALISVHDGRSIARIISEDGEHGFRTLETELLTETLAWHESSARIVLALGGGAWTLEQNRDLLRAQNFLIVWLDAPFHLCWRRIEAASPSSSTRPFATDMEKARRLYEERRKIYESADLRVQIYEDRNVPDTVAEIVDAI